MLQIVYKEETEMYVDWCTQASQGNMNGVLDDLIKEASEMEADKLCEQGNIQKQLVWLSFRFGEGFENRLRRYLGLDD